MSGYLKLSDGRTVALRDGLVIGRGKNCDIVLEDTKASRRHAKIIVEGGVVEVADLGSSNGSLLNGRPVEKRMMRAGDELQIGKTTLTLHDGEVPGSAPAAGSGSAAAGWDDDELDFGGDGGSTAASSAPAEPSRPASASPPAQPAPPPAPAPTPSPATPAEPAPASPAFDDDDELFGSDDPAPAAPPAAAPRAAPAPQPTPAPSSAPRPKKQNVVEFADEIVEVKKPTAKPRSQPGSAKASDGPVVESRQTVLQFSKNASSKGVLGDDVGQMSSGMRGLVFVLVIAGMGGVAWLVMNAVR